MRLVVVDDERALWTRATAGARWRLPAANVPAGQAPWVTARHLAAELPDHHHVAPELRLIQLANDRPALSFVFVAHGAASESVEDRFRWAALDNTIDAHDAADVALARAALAATIVDVAIAPTIS